jgi:hypothetical protein
MRILADGEPLLVGYACPGGYVSKIMAYGPEPPAQNLRSYLKDITGKELKEDEVRSATRHPWELALEGTTMKVAYWNQNYRSSQNENPDRQAIFVCLNCGDVYVKPLSQQGDKCPRCGGS